MLEVHFRREMNVRRTREGGSEDGKKSNSTGEHVCSFCRFELVGGSGSGAVVVYERTGKEGVLAVGEIRKRRDDDEICPRLGLGGCSGEQGRDV